MTITRAALETIWAHAEKGYPYEICGLLVGKLAGDEREIREAWPVENAWENEVEKAHILEGAGAAPNAKSSEDWDAHDRGRRFLVHPRDVVLSMKRARGLGMDLLGVYHTHPNHPAVPSGFDRDAATPGWSYIIVSVMEGRVAECRSWELEETGEKFFEEEVRVVE